MNRITLLLRKFRDEDFLWIIKRLLEKIKWLPIRLHIFYFFKFSGKSKSKLKHRFSGTIRWADLNDLSLLDDCYGNNKREQFKRRFEKNEHCIIAISKKGVPAGFGWITDKSEHLEDPSNCIFKIPSRTLYTYNWYIKPEFRLTGLWVGLMNFLIDSDIYNASEGIIGFVAHKNIPSIKTHIRFGFILYLRKVVLTVYKHPFSFDKNLEHNQMNISKITGLPKSPGQSA